MQLSNDTAQRIADLRPVLDDTDLLRQYRAGNETAGVELVDRHKDRLVNVLFWYSGQHDPEGEAALSICAAALAAARGAPVPGPFAITLYESLRNRAGDLAARRHWPLFRAEKQAPPSDPHATRLLAVLRTLEDHLRFTFILSVIGRLSHVEIAAVTGVPPWTVKERLNEARKRVHGLLVEEHLL